MTSERIIRALEHATDTREVVIGAGALARTGETLVGAFEQRSAQIVADGITFGVAGEAVTASLTAAGVEVTEPLVFPARPRLYASYDHVAGIVERLTADDAVPVAVGSGTLNDLVKRAAHDAGKPYMVVATAASMDGYTAFGASLTKDGYKQTLSCPAPRAIVADLDIALDAPPAMTASGYGDLLGKVTAGADWLLADALGVEPVDELAWDLVQGPLRESIGRPAALAGRDPDAMAALIEGLIMSGVAMQAYASSRPASGSEHQFSHLWEMEGLGRDLDPPLSHGYKVGLGSVAIAALYERLLERDLSTLDIDACRRAWPTFEQLEAQARAAHPLLGEIAVAQLKRKYVDADGLAERLERLSAAWPELRQRLESQLLPAATLHTMLDDAGCPTTPQQIGLDTAAFKATYARAQMIRSRYTVLDVAVETGLLDTTVDELFAPRGHWSNLPDT